VRRLAYEAADAGLLSPELAAGIHRVKGVRKLGSRLGNWLTAAEASALWQVPDGQTLTGKRNRAILAILLGCGLRRRELAELTLESLQRREERWAIVDLLGKGRQIRTVPVPNWVKDTLDAWLRAAGIESGPLFRCVCRAGKPWGTASQRRRSGTSSRRLPRVSIFHVSRHTICDAPVRDSAMMPAASLSRSNSFSGMSRYKQRSATSVASSV
jgi:integrase